MRLSMSKKTQDLGRDREPDPIREKLIQDLVRASLFLHLEARERAAIHLA